MKKFHFEGRCQYDLHCQLSAMSLQAAIPEGGSEEEPSKPTSRQASNYKIKKLQDLKEKSEKLKSSIQKENAQRLTINCGKIISGQERGQWFNKHLMTGHKGNSEFCFPETLNVPRGEAEGNIGRGEHSGRGETKLTVSRGASH